MKMTVLGNNGPFPSPGGACSGYLIEDDGKRILIDCGNGVLSNLQKFCRLEDLTAIILTHLHSDHISDLMVLKYAIQIKRKRGQMDRTIDIFAPGDPKEEYIRLDVKDAFKLKEITGDLRLSFGKLHVTFREMTHPVKAFAVAIEDNEKRFVFSGDTNWNEQIISFSRGSDVLMLDAGLLNRDKTDENVPHLTAGECGIIARKAAAKKLLLTHFWPGYDVDELVKEAKENFANTEATVLLGTYEV